MLEGAGTAATDALNLVRLELAEILRRRTELDEAAALAERTLAATSSATAEGAAVRARALMALGRMRAAQGQLPEAERLLQDAYEMYLAQDGPLGEMTLEAKNGLADTLVVMGQSPRAEPLFRELVEDVRRVYGDEHAEMGVALNNLGNALSDIPEKYAEAAEVYLAAADDHSSDQRRPASRDRHYLQQPRRVVPEDPGLGEGRRSVPAAPSPSG